MEIISANDGLLTNIEVNDLLQMRQKTRNDSGNHPIAVELQNRARIEKQVRQ